MSRKVKSVSFNLNDKFENEMYEYSKQFPNFSSFVKRLIQNSMIRREGVKHNPVHVQTDINNEATCLNIVKY